MASIKRHLVLAACAAVCAALLTGCASTPAAKPANTGAGKSYVFWPPFPDDPHIQFLASFGSSEDVSPTKSSGFERLVFGKESTRETLIDKPYGVAMRQGKIYVADMRSKALAVLDLRKKQTRLVGVSGTNRLEHPVAVAVADDGAIYVADNGRGAIFVYDSSERYSTMIGFPKFKPVAVAVHGDRLFACDLTSQQVHIFDRRTGARLGEIGSVGDEDGQFRVPLGVNTDKAGNVYVVDMMRCRVQKFSPEGKFISGFGTMGDYPGSFARPKHLAVDSDGIVYVVDAAFQNVQMFDDQNRILMHFGAAGSFPGARNLPAGVTISEDSLDVFADQVHPGFEAQRLVAVTNQFGPTKVVVYAMGHLRQGHTAQEVAASATKVPTGTGKPSAEQLQMQNPGGEEPPPEAGAEGAPSEPATPEPAKPQPPKAEPPKIEPK